jgi:hypothetical protein
VTPPPMAYDRVVDFAPILELPINDLTSVSQGVPPSRSVSESLKLRSIRETWSKNCQRFMRPAKGDPSNRRLPSLFDRIGLGEIELIGLPLTFERSLQASLSEAVRLASKSIEIHGELEGAVKDVLRIALAEKGLVYVEDEHLPFVRTCVAGAICLSFR